MVAQSKVCDVSHEADRSPPVKLQPEKQLNRFRGNEVNPFLATVPWSKTHFRRLCTGGSGTELLDYIDKGNEILL